MMEEDEIRNMQKVWYNFGQPLVNHMIQPLIVSLEHLNIYSLQEVKDELKKVKRRLIDLERKNKMPLVKGKKAKTKAGFSANIRAERRAGKPEAQSVAIAYSEARGGKKRKKK
jgi:hypothetical protein